MYLSHVIELQPNRAARVYFAKASGCARQAYNWGVEQLRNDRCNGVRRSAMDLNAAFNAVKRVDYKWQLEVTKCAAAGAFRNLAKAMNNFWAKRAKFPTLHRKYAKDSFELTNNVFRFDGKYVMIPKLGRVKMAETLRFQGKIMGAVVKRKADRWFIAVTVELPDPTIAPREMAVVGLDVGLNHYAVLSTGEKLVGPKALKRYLGKLRRLSRSLSRKQKGSNRRKGARLKLARLHYRISCQRKDFWHKLTTHLCRTYTHIGVEDLNIRGMIKNRRLARNIADAGWGMGLAILQVKAPRYGVIVTKADRFYPSSKTCNKCGYKFKELDDLNIRDWTCPSCGQSHDRDVNAAINLRNLAAGLAVTGRGGAVRPAAEVA